MQRPEIATSAGIKQAFPIHGTPEVGERLYGDSCTKPQAVPPKAVAMDHWKGGG